MKEEKEEEAISNEPVNIRVVFIANTSKCAHWSIEKKCTVPFCDLLRVKVKKKWRELEVRL